MFAKSIELPAKEKNSAELEIIEPIPHAAKASAVNAIAKGSLCIGARISAKIAAATTALNKTRSIAKPDSICNNLVAK